MNTCRFVALAIPVACAAFASAAHGGADQAAKDTEPGFSRRIEQFWTWFARDEERIHRRMFEKEIAQFAAKITDEVDDVSRSIRWKFGPGDTPEQHALVFIPGDNDVLRLLTDVWVTSAPPLERWSLRPCVPPANLAGLKMGIGEQPIDLEQCLVSVAEPGPENEDERATVAVYHPAFEGLDERTTQRFARTVVSDTLGGDAAALWLEEVTVSTGAAPEGAIKLDALRDALAQLASRAHWRTARGFDVRVEYEQGANELRSNAPRSDVRNGVTCLPRFIESFKAKRGRPRNPARGTGAELMYLQVPKSELGGDLTAASLEAKLGTLMLKSRTTGHAAGETFVYIDLLVLHSILGPAEIGQILSTMGDVGAATLHSYVRGGPDPATLK